MKKTILLTALMLLTACSANPTHEQVLTDTIASVDNARQTIAPLVNAICSMARMRLLMPCQKRIQPLKKTVNHG
jgi:uncharacterized lipoprotein